MDSGEGDREGGKGHPEGGDVQAAEREDPQEARGRGVGDGADGGFVGLIGRFEKEETEVQKSGVEEEGDSRRGDVDHGSDHEGTGDLEGVSGSKRSEKKEGKKAGDEED